MTDAKLKLRGEIKLQKCAVEGCNEVPSERLERFREPVWCKSHYDLVRHRIAERDYQDFVSKLREHGIKKEPNLISLLTPVEKRRCCVRGCRRGCITNFSFEPYKVPGFAPVCDAHVFALNYATQRMNPHRVVYEMAQARKGRAPDPYSAKRKEAILALCAKHGNRKGKNSIELICDDLQRQRVKLLAHWQKEWNERNSLGLQEWDWLVAYKAKNKTIKDKIQKYISSVCNPKVRASRKNL